MTRHSFSRSIWSISSCIICLAAAASSNSLPSHTALHYQWWLTTNGKHSLQYIPLWNHLTLPTFIWHLPADACMLYNIHMQYIIQSFHSIFFKINSTLSISKMKFSDFPWLCLALFPDPSEVQVLVLCNFLVRSSPTPTPFHHHFVVTRTEDF